MEIALPLVSILWTSPENNVSPLTVPLLTIDVYSACAVATQGTPAPWRAQISVSAAIVFFASAAHPKRFRMRAAKVREDPPEAAHSSRAILVSSSMSRDWTAKPPHGAASGGGGGGGDPANPAACLHAF
jgi:hypothetical protein